MLKLTLLLLIPLIFLSSCILYKDRSTTAPESITNKQNISEVPIHRNPEQDDSGVIQSFGSGFTLSQTDDETILAYSGESIKSWSHTPPEKVPFIWDDACEIVFKGFQILPPDTTGRQGVWEDLTEKEKKECMKESFMQKISIKEINQTFFEIRELRYENYKSWLYDTRTGNIQELPIEGRDIQISQTNSGITIFIVNNFDGNDVKLFYNTDFSSLLSKEEFLKQ